MTFVRNRPEETARTLLSSSCAMCELVAFVDAADMFEGCPTKMRRLLSTYRWICDLNGDGVFRVKEAYGVFADSRDQRVHILRLRHLRTHKPFVAATVVIVVVVVVESLVRLAKVWDMFVMVRKEEYNTCALSTRQSSKGACAIKNKDGVHIRFIQSRQEKDLRQFLFEQHRGKEEMKVKLKEEIKNELKEEMREELKEDTCEELKEEMRAEIRDMLIEYGIKSRVTHQTKTKQEGTTPHLSMNGYAPGFTVYGNFVKFGVRLDCVVIDTLLRGLCDAGCVCDALRDMDESGKGCRRRVNEYYMVIDGFCKGRRVSEAFEFFTRWLGEKGEVEEAHRIIDELMLDRGKKPDTHMYTTLLHGYCLLGKMDHASKIFDIMIAQGCAPCEVRYTSLMQGYYLCGEVDKARKIFKAMIRQGCAPCVVSCSILIDGYCKSEIIDKALNLIREMHERGIVPNLVTYTSLVNRLCLVGRLKEAFMLFDEIQNHGMSLNINTYSTLINSLWIYNKVKEASKLLKKMEGLGMVRDIVLSTSIIDGMCKVGKVTNARQLFNDLSDRGLQPNRHTYNDLISGYLKNGKLVDARDLLLQMTVGGLELDGVTYKLLITRTVLDDASKKLIKRADH
nr:hypothetical protein [Tanacetum cinerariifolium]